MNLSSKCFHVKVNVFEKEMLENFLWATPLRIFPAFALVW